jgi:hypothetical protein
LLRAGQNLLNSAALRDRREIERNRENNTMAV